MKNISFFSVLLIFMITIPLALGAGRADEDDCSDQCSNSSDNPYYMFDTAFSALIVQPSSSNLHYAAEAIPLPAPSPNWNIFDIHQSYRFGFDLKYKMMSKKNNTFMINWERFKTHKSASVFVGNDNMVGPFFEIGPDASPYKSAAGTVKFSFDEVNIDTGHCSQFGNRLIIDFFGGVGITRIKQTLCTTYSDTTGEIFRTITTPLHFVGAGPQVGVDFSYTLCRRLYFTGKALCSLLSGSVENHTNYSSTSPLLEPLGVTPPNEQKTCAQKRSIVVPAFEQKLGLACAFVLKNYLLMHIEIGFQSQIYLSALQSVDIGSEVVTPPVSPDTVGVYARTFQRNISNFSLAGPYVTIDAKF